MPLEYDLWRNKMKRGLFWRINQLMAAYILFFTFAPPLQVDNVYRILAVTASVIWFLTAVAVNPGYISGIVSQYMSLLLVLVFCLVVLNSLVVGLSQAIINNLQLIIVIIVGFIAFFYAQNDRAYYDYIVFFTIIAICAFCVTTIRGVAENPYAARIANSEWLEGRFEQNRNVGLYGYVYMCVQILPSLLYLRKKRIISSKILNLLLLVAIILIMYMVLTSGYMIAIFCTLVSIIALDYYSHSSSLRLFLFVLGTVGVVTLYNTLLPAFFSIAYSLVGDNPVYQQKLYAFQMLTSANTVTGDVLGRFSNYQASLNNVLHYPLIGAYILGKRTLGGGHSWILDNFSRYGVLVTILLMKLYWKTPQMIAGNGTKKHPLYKTVILISVIFGFLDPYPQEISIALFIFLPYVLLKEEKASI